MKKEAYSRLAIVGSCFLGASSWCGAANYFSADSAVTTPTASFGNVVHINDGAGLPGGGVADLTDENILTTSHALGFSAGIQVVVDGTTAVYEFTFAEPVEIGAMYLWNYTQTQCCPGRGVSAFEVFLDTGAGFTRLGAGILAEANQAVGAHFAQEIRFLAVQTGVVGVQIQAVNYGGNAIGLDEVVFSDAAGATNMPPTGLELTPGVLLATGNVTRRSVGRLITLDGEIDDTHTYQLVAGEGDEGNDSFEIVDDELIIKTNIAPGSYPVRIETVDLGGNRFGATFTVFVYENFPPTSLSWRVPIFSSEGGSPQELGFLSSDDPDFFLGPIEAHTYSLVQGAGDTDNVSFSIGEFDGKVTFIGTVEDGREYSFRVRVTDSGGFSFENSFTVSPILFLGRSLTPRSATTDTATTVFYLNGVPATESFTADGASVYIQNAGTQSGKTFQVFLMRPTGDADRYEVVYGSGPIVIENVIAGQVANFPFPNGPVEAQPGDVFAHYGSGIPWSQNVEGAIPIYFSVPTPPAVDTMVQLGANSEAAFPYRGDLRRDYAWAVTGSVSVPNLGQVTIENDPASPLIILRWSGKANRAYQIEGSTTMTSWPDIYDTNFRPETDEAVFRVDRPSEGKYFFRVLDMGIAR